VPLTAACRDGSASTANTVSADALIVAVALTGSQPAIMSADLVMGWRWDVSRGEGRVWPGCLQ
jgi:hypothetical protein